MDRWMDGWIDGWMNGWMDGWIDNHMMASSTEYKKVNLQQGRLDFNYILQSCGRKSLNNTETRQVPGAPAPLPWTCWGP